MQAFIVRKWLYIARITWINNFMCHKRNITINYFTCANETTLNPYVLHCDIIYHSDSKSYYTVLVVCERFTA